MYKNSESHNFTINTHVNNYNKYDEELFLETHILNKNPRYAWTIPNHIFNVLKYCTCLYEKNPNFREDKEKRISINNILMPFKDRNDLSKKAGLFILESKNPFEIIGITRKEKLILPGEIELKYFVCKNKHKRNFLKKIVTILFHDKETNLIVINPGAIDIKQSNNRFLTFNKFSIATSLPVSTLLSQKYWGIPYYQLSREAYENRNKKN